MADERIKALKKERDRLQVEIPKILGRIRVLEKQLQTDAVELRSELKRLLNSSVALDEEIASLSE